MHLYNLTLKEPTAALHAVVGSFCGGRQQEILISSGVSLQLYRWDASGGVLQNILSSSAFGAIRTLAAFKLTGDDKDYAVVGSDSGRLSILEYDPKTTSFVPVHQEPFGKSGARRIVPGQFLATDPRGRALMIAAVEKTKLVYILNRDVSANLTVSSPLEAHRNTTIVHHVVGVDNGFENPIFAALEFEYDDGANAKSSEPLLTYYELDLGLNHVVRRWSSPTNSRANLLVPVPGGPSASSGDKDGPSGVLVCCEDHIVYVHMDVPQHRVPIPRRGRSSEDAGRGLLIVAAVVHKLKGGSFILLQSEMGDIYKVTVEHDREVVKCLTIKYFDTVPVASSLCILKSGFLFVAAEFGNHHFYQFVQLGDDDSDTQYRSSSYPTFGMAAPSDPLPIPSFQPRSLRNLVLVYEIKSLCPILNSQVIKVLPHADTPQILTACGRGPRSTLRMLVHGFDVDEVTNTDLHSAPNGLWTVRLKDDDAHDAYIVLSFADATRVLRVGEPIEEVQDSGFLVTSLTLAMQQMFMNGLLQVYPGGIRHIGLDKHVAEWRVPLDKRIVSCATNTRQVVVALSSAELVYFELDNGGKLNEYQERLALGSAVLTIGIGEVPEGHQRTPHLAVGCEDQTVRMISLDPETALQTISFQALTAPPSSICIVDMVDGSISNAQPTTFVLIGLINGILLRTVMDSIHGQLSDIRARFVGVGPVRIVPIKVQQRRSVLAISMRTWLQYTYHDRVHFTPLISERMDYACPFSSEDFPEGFISVLGTVLRISRIPQIDQILKEVEMPLDFTPRKLIAHPTNHLLYLIESDHRAAQGLSGATGAQRSSGEPGDHPSTVVWPRAPAGTWASCIRVSDPTTATTLNRIPLDNNEAAFSAAIVTFTSHEDTPYLVVGTASDVVMTPRSCSSGYLRVYRFTEGGTNLELLHKTEADDVPLALLSFQGRLLAGIGTSLRTYEMGKKRLLRKAENKEFPSAIVTLSTQGSRIIVGDIQHSIFFVAYKEPTNRLLIFADDTQARWVTAAAMLDYCTVAAGDKFGNVFVNRLDEVISEEVDRDPNGDGILREKGILMGAAHKTALVAHFHIGDIITTFHKTSLVAGGREVLLYTALHGTIGILVPLQSQDDIDFLSALEQHMRARFVSPIGRDHLSWRGYYTPVKAVVDGDLCEVFSQLPYSQKAAIAGELDRTVSDVLKKLEQIRIGACGF
ncbi:hypothetical protein JAAARDRAFT_73058 [Jaapia argillacea MUCL 33604]|uniref:Pre-mRNA-splicing factor RSE1 n=1 Tax=Jaapia argillacea MUCL 33604 TaxID=933084 RepID=A0A067PFG2_9AGAM|nr:hypothetical protein JAAARDRAFT_73058 [Jaapia argillacea MUCL 33604]